MNQELNEEFRKDDEDIKLSGNVKEEMSPVVEVDKIKEERIIEDEIWQPSHPKFQETDCRIAEMIVLQDLSFNFVDSIGFQRLIKSALPRYHLRGSHFFSSYICEELYTRVEKKVEELLGGFEKISLTISVKENSGEFRLVTLMAHGFTEDFERMSLILNSESQPGFGRMSLILNSESQPLFGFRDSFISNSISNNFKASLQKWGLSRDSVHCVVINEISKNILETDLKVMNCTVNKIQCCVRAVLESQELKQFIAKLKNSDRYRYLPLPTLEKCKEIEEERLNQPGDSLLGGSLYRWSETLNHIFEIKDCVFRHPYKPISSDEWLNFEMCVQLLKFFEEITRELSWSKCSISSVIPLIQVLNATLQNEEAKTKTSKQKDMVRRIIDKVNSTSVFGDLVMNPMYSIATYFDPRYKSKFYNEIVKEKVESEIIKLVLTETETTQDDHLPPSPKIGRFELWELGSSNTSGLEVSLESILKTGDEKTLQTTPGVICNQSLVLKSMLQEYNKEPRLALKEDPLSWWKMNAEKYKPFLPVVRQFLSPPPSCVPSQDFIMRKSSSNEDDSEREIFRKIHFVKYNLPLINFDY